MFGMHKAPSTSFMIFTLTSLIPCAILLVLQCAVTVTCVLAITFSVFSVSVQCIREDVNRKISKSTTWKNVGKEGTSNNFNERSFFSK